MTEGKQKSVDPPLKGVKAIDFGWAAVVPWAMKYLGDWGATVVRIETHARPDVMRLMSPFKDGISGINNSTWWPHTNSSKLGVSLDLTNEKGKEIGWRLIKWADIMASGYAPGVMKRWGFDYESVVKVKPDIIYHCSSQMGQYGPRSGLAAWGYQSSALAGFSNLVGWPDREPDLPQGAYSDFICPPIEAGTIIAALDYRRRTGKGVYIDQSQMETAANMLTPSIMDYLVNGRVLIRNGNRLAYAAPHGAYPCCGDDRWVAIAVFTDDEWSTLCQVMGEPKLAKDPKFATLTARKANEDELDKLIADWTIPYIAEQLEILLQNVGIAAHVVNDSEGVFNDLQLKHRESLRRLKHSVIGVHPYPFEGFRMSKTPDSQFAAPAIGEHNEYVFKELLHMTDDEIADALIAGGITTDADQVEFASWL